MVTEALGMEELKLTLNDLKTKISELRKKGCYVNIAVLKAMKVPAKIKIAEIMKSDKDIQNAKASVEEVKKEIDEVFNQLQLENIDKINDLISEANIALDNNNAKGAENKYARIDKIYSELSNEYKIKIKEACTSLNNKITALGKDQIQKINKK